MNRGRHDDSSLAASAAEPGNHNSDEAPWNYMMATAIIYALPPIVIFYALSRYMAAGLTRGAGKG